MTRAAIYARKSSEQPGASEEARSVARQEAGARAWCASRGWEVTDVYTDDAVSGFLFAGRPSFQRMLRDAAAGATPADPARQHNHNYQQDQQPAHDSTPCSCKAENRRYDPVCTAAYAGDPADERRHRAPTRDPAAWQRAPPWPSR